MSTDIVAPTVPGAQVDPDQLLPAADRRTGEELRSGRGADGPADRSPDRSADRPADPADDAPTGSACIVLRLGGSRFAVPMAAVAEVLGVPRLTRVPGAPAWLAGVANWRGRVLPVLDLRSLVGADRTPLAGSARLVVLAHGAVEAGVLADAVPGLLADGTDLGPTPVTVPAAAAALVEGVVDDGGPVAVLDAAAVLALRSQLPRAR